MSPPSFPIEPGGLRGAWSFDALDEGSRGIAGWHVAPVRSRTRARDLRLPRRGHDRAITVRRTHAPAEGCSEELRDLVADVDVLVHDAQFRRSEPERKPYKGPMWLWSGRELLLHSTERCCVRDGSGPCRLAAKQVQEHAE
jgi:hypothetical protein